MTKKEFKILEKVFVAEIEGRLYQGKCKSVKMLEEEGYIEKRKKVFGRDCFGIIEVEGYNTTLKGNYHYCTNC